RNNTRGESRGENNCLAKTVELRLDLMKKALKAIWIAKMVRQVGAKDIEFHKKAAIVAKKRQGDSEAAHYAEIVFFRAVLEKRLQHAEREYQRCQRQGDSQDQWQVLLRAVPKTTQGCQKPTDCAQIRHQCPT